MKIEYDFRGKYIKFLNTAYGIYSLRKKIKKNPQKRIIKYFTDLTITFLYSFSIFSFSQIYAVQQHLPFFVKFLKIMVILTIIYYFCGLLSLIYMIINNSKSCKGEIKINEIGIYDYGENKVVIGIPYEKIDFVYITKELIVIIAKMPFFIYFNNYNVNLDEFQKTIKKYYDVDVIIRKEK